MMELGSLSANGDTKSGENGHDHLNCENGESHLGVENGVNGYKLLGEQTKHLYSHTLRIMVTPAPTMQGFIRWTSMAINLPMLAV